MKMRRILDDHLTCCDRVPGIDKDVEMAATRNYRTGCVNLHAVNTHFYFDGRSDGLPVLKIFEVDLGPGRDGWQRGNSSSLSTVFGHLHGGVFGSSSRVRVSSLVASIIAGNHADQQDSRKKVELAHVMVVF